jgi:N-acetylglucosaminyl-diphospho-decaprenol L-rhamnosyltransferase
VPEPGNGAAAVAPDLITVVLVTYNSAAVLPWSTPPLAAHPHVIVVDNASSDDTVATVRRLLPQARLIEPGRNLGFGRANNLGLAAATTPWALVLNPDARLEPGCLQALAAATLRWPEAALLAPVLFDAPGRVGDFYRGPFSPRDALPGPVREAWRQAPEGDACAEFVTGAAMLFNRPLMQGVGYFDPWFFLYHEDDELCGRVREKQLPIIVVADARLEHHTRGSSRPSLRTTWRRAYAMTLSKLYLTRRRHGEAAWRRMAWRMGVAGVLAAPLMALALRWHHMARHAARAWAAWRAHDHLQRPHCFEPAD